MQTLIELAPLIAFFATYKWFGGIYPATAVLMVGMLLLIGTNDIGVIAAMVLWGVAFGVVQLSQINMTLAAAPETFEAAMSLNTMAYNTCIALGALIGGLFADHTGVTSVVWLGIVLVALAVLLRAVEPSSRYAPAPCASRGPASCPGCAASWATSGGDGAQPPMGHDPMS